MFTRCGTTCSRSVCVPANANRHASQRPHPISTGSVHISAAANANAACERPAPGGPVKSQAWVMA